MAPLVNPAVWATSSSEPSSMPRSAKTCSPASISSDLVSALRLARTIPISIYDTDWHPYCNLDDCGNWTSDTYRYLKEAKLLIRPLTNPCDVPDCAAEGPSKRLGHAPRPPSPGAGL